VFILNVYTSHPLTCTTHTLTHVHAITHNPSIIAPGDYGALTDFRLGSFSNGVRQLSFNVSIVNDVIPEDDETFIANLTLLPADQARLGNRVTVQPDSATVTIQDDEGTIAVDKRSKLPVHLQLYVSTAYVVSKHKHCLHLKGHLPEIADDSMVHIRISVNMHNFVHSTVITVGYVDTAVSVFESAGVAELTVAISAPNPSVPIETSFFLLVDTNDGTATAAGLSSLS